MAAPNIVAVTTITGKTAVQAVTTTATAIVENAADSGKVLKINALLIANIHATNGGTISVEIYRNSTAYKITNAITVPINSTLDALSKAIYLEEGDSLRLQTGVDNVLEAVCSYEELS